MKLQDLLQKNAILVDLDGLDKPGLLSQMAHYLCSLYSIKDADAITQCILDRESEMSTGIGFGIAIPHARVEGIERVYMVVGRCPAGIEFHAIDENPVHLIFMMISPKNTAQEHTLVLSTLSKMMSVAEVRDHLLVAADAETFYTTIIDAENRYVG